MTTIEHEVTTFWAIAAELTTAEAAGDVTELQLLHAELEALAMHASSAAVRRLAGARCDREMAAAV